MPDFSANAAPTSPDVAPSLLDRLRSETRPVHERLERDLDLAGKTLSLPSYCQCLQAFYGFYKPFEERAYANMPAQLDQTFATREKVPNLESDLHFFGIDPEQIILCPFVPNVSDMPTLLGALYVTEGATLGGQLISRHLEKHLGLKNGGGYKFFRSYGESVSAMWKEFRARLLEQSSEANDDLIVQGAGETFEAMHKWLCPPPTVSLPELALAMQEPEETGRVRA